MTADSEEDFCGNSSSFNKTLKDEFLCFVLGFSRRGPRSQSSFEFLIILSDSSPHVPGTLQTFRKDSVGTRNESNCPPTIPWGHNRLSL